MKILINDFGPIKKFSYDLSKDFVVTYGNNNIGKSYSMQIVYLLLKTFIDYCGGSPKFFISSYYTFDYNRFGELQIEKYKKIISDFVSTKEDSKDITNDILSEFYDMLSNGVMPSFLNSCDNTFGNFEKTLDKNPTIEVEFGDFNFKINLGEKRISGFVRMLPIRLKKTDTDFHKSRKFKNYMDVYVTGNNVDIPVGIITDSIRSLFVKFTNLINSSYDNVYFLPASRSGIYSGMNAFGSIIAELSKNRAFLTKKIELPGISEPISDYFIFLSNIKPRISEKYVDFYSRIENEILKGTVSFDKNRNALVYKPDNMESEFGMTEVSSMVSEVSPIVAFLKYILASPKKYRNIKSKSILFIEEPEAHLHPNNQIALIEIFTQLASLGVQLIISSHSNYVFNKLNNLVLSRKLDYKIYQPIILETKDEGSISKILEIDELGANDENFVDVSEKLYFEREEIIQKLNLGE